MKKVKYFDIAWISKVDGPGNRVVLFLQGCHLRCPWCHSPHSWEPVAPLLFNPLRCVGCGNCLEVCEQAVHVMVSGSHLVQRQNCVQCGQCIVACPTSTPGNNGGALALPTRELETQAIFQMLLPQLEVVKACGGLTLSGGEALLQKEAVRELLQLCKNHGIHTAVETSLTLPREAYTYVGDLVDCWLIGLRDVALQKDNPSIDEVVLQNLRYLSSTGREVIVRWPIIKGYTDSRTPIARLVTLMQIGELTRIELLPCNSDMEHYYHLCGIEPALPIREILPDAGQVEAIADYFHQAGFSVTLTR